MDISTNELKEIGRPIDKIYLWGMMGVGKTKTAKQLAKKMGWQFVDTDEHIEGECGKKISQIFAEDGEHTFRKMERKAIEQLSKRSQVVISTGGGLPCFFDNSRLMKENGLTIWLDGSINFLTSRLIESKQNRPLLSNIESKQELTDALTRTYNERLAYYQKAHWKVDALNLNLHLLVQKLNLV
ncbi:shikimate kinase [Salibacteraceae bacterium]|nr:shikimate kinase [Salibacteraceae bacterium]